MATSFDTSDIRCFTLTREWVQDEALGHGELASKVSEIADSMLQQPVSQSPSLFLISACGDPYGGNMARRGSRDKPDEFHDLEELLGVDTEPYDIHTILRAHCAYFFTYDSPLQNPTSMTIILRLPRNMHALVLALKIHFPSYTTVALLYAKLPTDLSELHALFSSNKHLLLVSPISLLSLLYDQRSRAWESWVTKLWMEINEIEGFTKMAPSEWIFNPPSLERSEELKDVDKLLAQLSSTHVEICHGLSVMEFATVRFGGFCEEVLQRLGGEMGAGERAAVEDRIRSVRSRCEGVRERFVELGDRHRGQMGLAYNLIAQKESKRSRAVAEISLDVARITATDSRVMKTISVLGAVFLPSTFTTSMWTINIFQLDEDTNRRVYIGATVALTLVVLSCWWTYMRFSRKPLDRYRNTSLEADVLVV